MCQGCVRWCVFPLPLPEFNLMAHSAVWGRPPTQRQNTNSKKLAIEKLSKNGLRSCTKFGQPYSNEKSEK